MSLVKNCTLPDDMAMTNATGATIPKAGVCIEYWSMELYNTSDTTREENDVVLLFSSPMGLYGAPAGGSGRVSTD